MPRSRTAAFTVLALCWTGCGPAPSSPPVPPPASTPATAAPAESTAATAATAATDRTAVGQHEEPTPPTQPEVSEIKLIDVKRVVAAPIHSVAIHPERENVAALGDQPWLDAGQGWHEIALPDSLRAKAGEREVARIYFGRDHQPRIMGTRIGKDGPHQLYLRYRLGAWREDPRELGSFSGPPAAALYGVLGWDDPEVVCKVGQFCLIKQRSGWSQAPVPIAAPKTALRIDLTAGGVYALCDRSLLRLDKARWAPIGTEGPWQGRPAAAWLDGSVSWVSAPAEDALYRHDGQRWTRLDSPVKQPRGLWAAKPGELWIAGQDGGGYFDGQRFWRIGALPGPLREVIGRGAVLWFGGTSGLWTGKRPSS